MRAWGEFPTVAQQNDILEPIRFDKFDGDEKRFQVLFLPGYTLFLCNFNLVQISEKHKDKLNYFIILIYNLSIIIICTKCALISKNTSLNYYVYTKYLQL